MNKDVHSTYQKKVRVGAGNLYRWSQRIQDKYRLTKSKHNFFKDIRYDAEGIT